MRVDGWCPVADMGECSVPEDSEVIVIYLRPAAILMSVLLSGCQHRDARSVLADKCAFASRYVAHVQGQGTKKVVFSTFPERIGESADIGGWDGSTTIGPVRPPRELIVQLIGQHGISALVSCPMLTARLRAKGMGVGQKAVAQSLDAGGGAAYTPPVVGVSLPSLSDDGNEAVLASSYVFGIEGAGSGDLIYFRRDSSGKWAVVSSSRLWVS